MSEPSQSPSAARGGFPAELRELAADFEIDGVIGRGGTAVVYLARERALDRKVAVKIVRGRYVDDDELTARLEREARLVARLAHPNVVTLYGVRRLAQGSLALVMQYVDGVTLRQWLHEHGRLPIAEARRILVHVARALAAAHAHGVVHRDVKPENIHLTGDPPRALLGDFGSAAPLDGDSQLTMTGMTIGTPGYMAPELIDGAPATPAADVYALGLVAWEMLAGQPPWQGSTLFDLLGFRKHGELAPIEEMRPDVTPELARAVAGALRREPADRWPTVDALLETLGAAPRPARLADVERDAPRPTPSSVASAPPAPTQDTVRLPVERHSSRPTVPPPAPPAPATAPSGAADPPPVEPRAAAPPVDPALMEELRRQAKGTHEGSATAGGRWRRRVATIVVLAAGVAVAVLGRGDGSDGAPGDRTVVASGDAAPTREVPLLRGAPADAPTGPAAPAAAPPAPAAAPSADAQPAPAVSNVRDSLPPNVAAPATPPPPSVSPPPLEAERDAPRTSPAAPTAPPPAQPAGPPVVPPRVVPAPTRSSPAPAEVVAAAPGETSPRGTGGGGGGGDATGAAAGGMRAVSLGGLHSCAVLRDGGVACWGANDRGQGGIGGGRAALAPVELPAGARFRALALGLAHSCGRTDDGGVLCWGANEAGQLGDGTRTPHAVPSRVALPARATRLALGAAHSCALDTDGRIHCWGSNAQGQLGIGRSGDQARPVRASSEAAFIALAAGWHHTCALTADGRTFCWGANGAGQLGVEGGDRRAPAAVGGVPALRALTAGSAHSCGLTVGGTVLCWGRNRDGQLGDGTRSGRPAAREVRLPAPATAVAAGSTHTCALLRDGEVHCWGQNRYGQLGDGTTGDRAAPVRVVDAPRFLALDVSGAHSCGVTADGDVHCWGYNLDGQLGDGTRSNRSRPAPVRRAGA